MRRSILLFLVTGMFLSVFAGFNISWMESYGGADDDNCYNVIETSDGYYLMTGGTYSYGAGNNDYWLIKTDTDGDTVWMDTYGGSEKDRSFSVIETSDGHYLFGGDTYSYGAGGYDCWLIKTDTA